MTGWLFFCGFGGSIEGGQSTPSNKVIASAAKQSCRYAFWGKSRRGYSHAFGMMRSPRPFHGLAMTPASDPSLRGGNEFLPTKQSCRYCFCGFWGKVRKGGFALVLIRVVSKGVFSPLRIKNGRMPMRSTPCPSA